MKAEKRAKRANNLNHEWTPINLTRLAPQPQILDCGGKRSATPLLETTGSTESGVAAALCHRSPNLCHPCAKLQDCITDKGETRISRIDANSVSDNSRNSCQALCPLFPIRVNPCPSVIKIPCVFCGYATLIANSGQRIRPSKGAIHP